jgi:hypothetical protein
MLKAFWSPTALLSAYGSYSRLSSLLARSSPSLSSSPALTRSNSIISPNFARRPPFLLDLQPFSRTYAHKSSPSPRSPSIVPSSGTSFEPITSETVISLVQAEHAKIVQSLSTSRFLPPSRLLPLLRNPEIPTLFALQTTESLMDAYTQVDQHLVGKEGKQVQAGRKAVAGAAWEVEESWQDLLKRKDVTEAERKAYEGRLFPDLITISVMLVDWEMLASIIGRFHKRQIRTEDPELAEQVRPSLLSCLAHLLNSNPPKLIRRHALPLSQFLNALSAFLNSSQPQTADPARSRSLTSQSLSLVLASANGRQLSSALKDLWPLLNKNRNLIPPTVFERLLPIAIEKKQVQIVEEMWDVMKSRPPKILKLYAHHVRLFRPSRSSLPESI